jgi:hypothetical protein
VFHIVSNIFSLISNEVLISLHNCLDSTHTNCPATMCGVFNFLYKETTNPIIFFIYVLRLSIIYVNVSFYDTIKFFKNITLHIKLKNLLHRAGLQTSSYDMYCRCPHFITCIAAILYVLIGMLIDRLQRIKLMMSSSTSLFHTMAI